MPAKDLVFTSIWSEGEATPYKVEYYYQNILDDEYSIEETQTQNLFGKTNSTTSITADEVEGFTLQNFDQKKIEPDGTTVIQIKYNRNEYTINFDSDGGSLVDSITMKYGTTIVLPENPTKTGYNFNGWDLGNITTMPANDLHLTANWSESTETPYKVEHYQQNIEDDLFTLVDTENKAGKTNSNTNATAKDYEGFTSQAFTQQVIEPDGSTIIKIYYNRNSYTINFDTDGGNLIAPKTYKFGQAIDTPPNPKKNLWLFVKWNPELPTTMPSNSIETKSIWYQPIYNITYKDMNGDNFSGNFETDSPTKHTYGNKTNLISPVKENFVFNGWFSNANCSGNPITVLDETSYTADITLYAKWSDRYFESLAISELEEYLSKIEDKQFIHEIHITDTNPVLSKLKTILNNYPDIKFSYDLSECSELKEINNSAFYNCKNLFEIIIPNNVTSIEITAFKNCSRLSSVTIPSSVTSIGSSAFFGCSSLSSITIPSSVTSIDSSAFHDCTSLSSVTIPSSVTFIGVAAFKNCSNLSSVTIPSSVTTFQNDAFRDCSSLSSVIISEGVTSIESSAFRDCSSLSSVTIPSSVSSIGSSAFCGCSSLSSVTIPSSITSISSSTFQDCSSLSTVSIPEGVKTIYNKAFQGCSSLSSITIPSSVTSIGSSAFQGCTSLSSVTIPEFVTSIESSAFQGCSSLSSVNIPSGVLYISDSTFKDCSSLSSVTIPEGVKAIHSKAFQGCSSLTSVNIPSSVINSIYSDAFSDCNNISQITVDTNNKRYDSRDNCNAIILTSTKTLIVGCKDTIIPSSVTSIDSYAFQGCSGLTAITIPSSVTSISDNSFSGCTNLINIYYTGTEEQWNDLNISSTTGIPDTATITFNYEP